ncbi:hypothetical protein OOT00_03260 [Desulfobotulus sp. H1]|uniref:Uncharacterized protein n=1 Tax=Desulfobotulus pelophilus TaxID=2823377 RepID=A0ABT3N6D1_9BACT|nr:hypothetical protein [Desulfobotulus pelophilus]MCW7753000.1 hypothetical protein [Desulfobotulus pelophilus]
MLEEVFSRELERDVRDIRYPDLIRSLRYKILFQKVCGNRQLVV